MMSTTRTRRPRLETVRRRLDRWRQTRAHPRMPLPPRLWTAAMALVAEHGLYGTARALQLDYGTLKRHVDATGGPARGRVPAGFVELSTPPPAAHDGWLLEVEGARSTVRCRLHGVAITDLAHFTRLVVGPEA